MSRPSVAAGIRRSADVPAVDAVELTAVPVTRIHSPFPTRRVYERPPRDDRVPAVLRVPDSGVNESEAAALHHGEGIAIVSHDRSFPRLGFAPAPVEPGAQVTHYPCINGPNNSTLFAGRCASIHPRPDLTGVDAPRRCLSPHPPGVPSSAAGPKAW